MWNILKNECKRSLLNKWTIISMLIVSVFCVIHFNGRFESRMMYLERVNELGMHKSENVCISTAYENWIFFEPNLYRYALIFVLPILAVLPYGISYYSDLKSGYIKQIATRISMKVYTRAKYIATFLSGGVAITLPLFVQFLLTATIYPLHKPYRFNGSLIGQYSFATDFFYEHPVIYTILRMLIIFVISGLLATVSLLVSKYIYNLFSVFITPFVVSFILQFITKIIGEDKISFMALLPADCNFAGAYTTLCIEILVLFVVSYFGFVTSKKEVY